MTAVARMTVLVMRTVAPYRTQGLVVFGVIVLIDSRPTLIRPSKIRIDK